MSAEYSDFKRQRNDRVIRDGSIIDKHFEVRNQLLVFGWLRGAMVAYEKQQKDPSTSLYLVCVQQLAWVYRRRLTKPRMPPAARRRNVPVALLMPLMALSILVP